MIRRALVIGGSLGGLLAAHLLRQAGLHTVVFERNEEDLTGRGVGLGTHPQLIAILRRAGIAFDASMGIKVPKVICLDRAGQIVVEQPSARTMSSWSRLYRALRAALPARDYRLGKKLRRVEQDSGGVNALFEDGTSERGDLLVGADGIRSTVREQFLPQAQPVYAGYVAWRAVLEEPAVPAHVREQIFELYTFCLPDGEQLLGYPVPGHDGDTMPGRRRYNIALPARQRDHVAAERQLYPFETGKTAGDIFAGAAEAIGQDRGVDCRLGRASADMRTNHKSGIAEQRHAVECQCGRFQIEDRLKEWLRAQKNLRQLRRKQRLGVRFNPCDHFVANE